jgi:hypothetical protein
MRYLAALALLTLSASTTACATSATLRPASRGIVRAGTPEGVDIGKARAKERTARFSWLPFEPASFEKAKREHKLVLIDGAAAWCHWCHVMDETTYLDDEVGAALAERFVTIRVDIDARPDLAERYGAWGWPATIVMSPDAEELGKFRGYLPPEEMRAMLRTVASAKVESSKEAAKSGDRGAPVRALPWLADKALFDLDAYFDPKEGGWGRQQKSPLGANAEVELRRAAHGDKGALERALFSLTQQEALIDPVWGGVYQYSAGRTWKAPHYEKLMTYQADNLTAYARASTAAKKAGDARADRMLADARAIAGYMSSFLSNADGAFLVSQDADVNAHDERATFVDGDVYYRKDDAGRRALGLPRVDDHVYPAENGLAIAAFVALYEATGDASSLARARRAADLVAARFVGADGSVRRATSEKSPRFAADYAAFGLALARLSAHATDHAPDYLATARRIADALDRDLLDAASGLYFAHTADPNAAGVFQKREHPFTHQIAAARLFAALARLTHEARYAARAKAILAAVSTPRALEERGRMLGDYLLALDEIGALDVVSALDSVDGKPARE